MAVTALWRVKGYIGKVLLYAENPEKTSNPEIIQVPKELNRDILEDVIAYAGRDKATNQRQLVWGINCTAENARHEMMAVKVERRGIILRLRPPGKERFVRFDTLGESYTEEGITNRLLRQQRREHPPQPPQPIVRKAKVMQAAPLSLLHL